jgi:long-chain fatty acid transport protein
MRTRKLSVLGAALAAGGMVSTAALATDGYFANGYGLKGIAMGGAATAVALEPFGGATNPGAMSFLGNEWQLGVAWFSPRREASRTGSGQAGIDASVDSGSNTFFIPEVGVNWRYRPDLALGITVFGNGGMNTDYPGGQIPAQSACGSFRQGQGAPYNLLCGSGALGVDLMQLMIAPYASWQFVKNHSVGITPVIAWQRFRAEGLQAFDNPGFSTSPGSVTNRGYDSSWGVGVRVGYMGQLTEQFSVGATYASKIAMDEFDQYKGLFAEEGGFDIPSNFSVGIAFRPTHQWIIALDFERIYYDDVPSVNNPSHWIAPGNCLPSPGGPGQRQYCLGASSGAGFGWQPVNVWKIGVQYQIEKWSVRAGYNRTENPIGPSDVTFNILAPGIVQDQYSVGLTWRIDRDHEVSGAAMYAAHNSVTGPSLFNDFGLPSPATETIGMKEYLFGVAYSFKF